LKHCLSSPSSLPGNHKLTSHASSGAAAPSNNSGTLRAGDIHGGVLRVILCTAGYDHNPGLASQLMTRVGGWFSGASQLWWRSPPPRNPTIETW
jgi:hypothetical protein